MLFAVPGRVLARRDLQQKVRDQNSRYYTTAVQTASLVVNVHRRAAGHLKKSAHEGPMVRSTCALPLLQARQLRKRISRSLATQFRHKSARVCEEIEELMEFRNVSVREFRGPPWPDLESC